jgi:hypothetical protein
MLYLMMSETNKKFLVKVGFSNGTVNLHKRRKSYYSHNPGAIMRSTCAGTLSMETKCHVQLGRIGNRIVGTEWYEIPKEIFDELYEKGMAYFRPNHHPIHFLEKF